MNSSTLAAANALATAASSLDDVVPPTDPDADAAAHDDLSLPPTYWRSPLLVLPVLLVLGVGARVAHDHAHA